MRPSSSALAIVARGLALRLLELSFPPDAAHALGISRVIADRLPRVFAPGATGEVSCQLPPSLAAAVRISVPVRDKKWYRALAEPRRKTHLGVGGFKLCARLFALCVLLKPRS